jgi:hypothetical protein
VMHLHRGIGDACAGDFEGLLLGVVHPCERERNDHAAETAGAPPCKTGRLTSCACNA